MNKRILYLIIIFPLLLAACASEQTVVMPTAVELPGLTVYASPTTTLAVEADLSVPTATAHPLPTVTPIVVEISDGDTLLAVASRFGITLDALLAANPGLDPQFLSIGTVIEIPRVDEDGTVVGLPQATAVPLAISTPACVSDAVRGVWCVVNVNNDQGTDMENVLVSVQLIDLEGAAVANVSGTLLLNRLPVGEEWPVLVHFLPPVPGWHSAQAQLSAALPVAEIEGRYLVTDLSAIEIVVADDGKAAEVNGTIEVAGEGVSAETVFVMLVAYDAGGNVVGASRWEYDEGLAAGDDVPFSAWVYSLGAEIANVAVFAEAK